MPENTKKKKCFVVMGFGKKTDFQSGRVLDLDKTYRVIIKRAVEAAGLECIRADDVVHSGCIDKPMYKLLNEADVVIADLSTSNANAIYELGVRHALRPFTTICIAESEFKFPFDLSHLVIRPYRHLGEGIDAEDAEAVRDELTNALKKLTETPAVDSPVHMFLPELLGSEDKKGIDSISKNVEAQSPEDTITSVLWDSYYQARAKEEFLIAKAYLEKLQKNMPSDTYVIQQLALVTYKSKQPDAQSALLEAKKILKQLNPETTNDTETLGLWGAIHKRLWEIDKNKEFLEEAIQAYEKGFHLRNDYYNGINYAFLLNVRAKISEPMEAITDFKLAERIRKRTLEICEKELEVGPKDEHGQVDKEQLFWLKATRIEAKLGLGEDVKELKQEAAADSPEPWMLETMEEQLQKLQDLLEDSPTKFLKDSAPQ